MDFFTKLRGNESELWKLAKQFIKFGIVGLSNTFISLAIYYILIHFKVYYIVENSIAFAVSVLNAYYWNNKFVFKKSSEGNSKPMIKTFMSYGTTFILSTILLGIMVGHLNISEVIAPIIILIITIPLNFLMNKFWAFR